MENANKSILRKRILAERGMFWRQKEAYADASRRAQLFLTDSAVWNNARRIALYAPVRGETDTLLLDVTARRQGKTVMYPRCVRNAADEPGLEFAVCPSFGSLVSGAYGIMEPSAALPAERMPPDLLVVPAVGMDGSGYRLGYGGGYYDRLLASSEWSGVISTGLIFSFQFFKAIPRSSWDKPLCGSVTERGCVWL